MERMSDWTARKARERARRVREALNSAPAPEPGLAETPTETPAPVHPHTQHGARAAGQRNSRTDGRTDSAPGTPRVTPRPIPLPPAPPTPSLGGADAYAAPARPTELPSRAPRAAPHQAQREQREQREPDAQVPQASQVRHAADVLDADRILDLPMRSGVQRGRVRSVMAELGDSHDPRDPAIAIPALPSPLSGAAQRRPAHESKRAPAMTPLADAMQVFAAQLSSRRSRLNAAGTPAPRAADESGRRPDACPICHGAGYVRQEVPIGDPSFGQAIPCQCKERQNEEHRRSDLRRLSNLDPFLTMTFETYDTSLPGVREAFDVARRYADDPNGWLILQGSYGVGKTHLAAAIANQHLAAGNTVFFNTVPELLDHLRTTFAPNSETTYDALFDKIREASLLVLDDLGSENSTAWATEKLFQLINYRYNYRMPMVVTTNHKLLSHLDERIRSRLADVSLARSTVIEAQSFRERHAGRGVRGGQSGQQGMGGGRGRPPAGAQGPRR